MHPLPPRKKKLKRYQVFILVFIAFLITFYIVARATNGLQYYDIPTGANEPTIKVGDFIFGTNLREPKRFDFICYRFTDSMFGSQIRVHRICGLPGDRIEIRNDTLFVNEENADSQLNLRKSYVIPKVNLEEYGIAESDISPTDSKDSILAILQTQKDSSLIKKGRLYISDVGEDQYIKHVFQQPWSASNFGPYIVPIGKYFLLGDNRHESQDSRYVGPIDTKQYVGTVLGRQ